MSAVPKPVSIEQLDLPQDDGAGCRVLSVVPDVPAAFFEAPLADPVRALRSIDVVMCCAQADLVPIGRIFDALSRHGCTAMAMAGVERDPTRLTESAHAAGEPRLYVLCKTPSVDSMQAHRLVRAFARSGRRGDHQLLVLEVDLNRIYAAVPQIRRGADQLRRRLEHSNETLGTPTVEVPRAGPRRPVPPPQPPRQALPRRADNVDTSYAMHRSESTSTLIDRIVVDVEPVPRTPARRDVPDSFPGSMPRRRR